MKKVIGLGAIGGALFGLVALVLGLTLFSVILIFSVVLVFLAFVLYYTRAIPLTIINRITDLITPKRRRRRWSVNLETAKLMQIIFVKRVMVTSVKIIP